ncbi:MAG: nucleoside deaminase [Rhodomicrobium sp.]|jgi:tRNA(adenine34) deaminase
MQMGLLSEAVDRAMMTRCIELSTLAARQGEYPFGCLIALDGRIVAEATNRTVRDNDVCRHAEVIALSLAQQAVGRSELPRATLYSTVEPCAMCSYCIREAWVGRVVYALASPIMGGASKWNILRDRDLSNRIPIFGPAPEVVSGVMLREVMAAWRAWSPLAWQMVRLRGVLAAQAQDETVKTAAAHKRSIWQHIVFAYLRASGRTRPLSIPIPPQQGTDP